MAEGRKTKDEAPDELTELRRRITQLEAAEAQRSRTEAEYRSLIEASPDAVVMADFQGRVVVVSQQTSELLGISRPEELQGRSVLDYVIADDRPRLAANLSGLIQT